MQCDDKARMVKYSQGLNEFEKVMDWDKKVEMVKLGNQANDGVDKASFHKFVLDNISDFDVQAYDMLFTVLELIPDKMRKDLEFYEELYSVAWSVDTNRLSFRANMRRHYFLTICEEEFNIQKP